MNSILSAISLWNIIVILYLMIIINIIYLEIKDMNIEKETVNSRYAYRYIENWRRMNNEYFNQLVRLDLIGVRKSIYFIHSDFKKLLENKFGIHLLLYENTKSDNNAYLPYITNPELKEFMVDPFLWIRPHYIDTQLYFDTISLSRGMSGSNHLFPIIRNLETMILEEVGLNPIFKYDNIDKKYELFLQNKIVKKRKAIIIGFSLLNILISLIMFSSSVKILDILITSVIGFILIYFYYKFL